MIVDEAHRAPLHQLSEPGVAASSQSAVSWAAVFAGAAGAAALSLILLMLGSGVGMASISPWSQSGVSASTFGIGAAVWICLMQLIASGMGGYLAGRLRTKWVATHTDEVYFRDTAHGFLAWSVATLVTAGLLTTAVGGILGAGAQAGGAVAEVGASTVAMTGAGAVAAGSKGGDDASGGMGYFVDSLFRKDPGAAGVVDPTVNPGNSSAEAGRVFVQSIKSGSLSQEDANYLGQLVAQRTGLSQGDATKRVNDAFSKLKSGIDETKAKAKEAADAARKATSYTMLWLFISLLVGAFSASLAATYGGRRRDL